MILHKYSYLCRHTQKLCCFCISQEVCVCIWKTCPVSHYTDTVLVVFISFWHERSYFGTKAALFSFCLYCVHAAFIFNISYNHSLHLMQCSRVCNKVLIIKFHVFVVCALIGVLYMARCALRSRVPHHVNSCMVSWLIRSGATQQFQVTRSKAGFWANGSWM